MLQASISNLDPGLAAGIAAAIVPGLIKLIRKRIKDEFIPLISLFLGLGVMLLADYFTGYSYSFLSLCALGIVSGLAGVGGHQVPKQLNKIKSPEKKQE